MYFPKFVVFSWFCLISFSFGCQKDDAQIEFQQRALRTPSEITETDQFGTILSSDSDDWRISPLYVGLISVEPAFPNPTSGEILTIEISVSGVNNLFGFNVYYYNDQSGLVFLDAISFDDDNFFQVIQINPLRFSPTSILAGAIGFHRVIIYDQRNEIITYGDIKVE